MREILFRGKRIDNGEWVYGYYFKNEYIDDYLHYIICDIEGSLQIKYETIGQFTGLMDENGVKIFEGDKIRIPDDYDTYGMNAGEDYEVYFAYGGFRCKPKYRKKAKGFWLEDDGELEIIGNIYESNG